MVFWFSVITGSHWPDSPPQETPPSQPATLSSGGAVIIPLG